MIVLNPKQQRPYPAARSTEVMRATIVSDDLLDQIFDFQVAPLSGAYQTAR